MCTHLYFCVCLDYIKKNHESILIPMTPTQYTELILASSFSLFVPFFSDTEKHGSHYLQSTYLIFKF